MTGEETKSMPASLGIASQTMTLRPVGIVKNEIMKPVLAAREDGLDIPGKIEAAMAHFRKLVRTVSEIVIDEQYIDLLHGIDDFSHIVVLYWAHKVPDERRSLTRVHPMGRKEIPLKGIFSTCSPARPNPVLMTVVQLRGRKENVLEVTGLDAVNGSPVIDIKPYASAFHPREDVRIAKWMEQILKEVEEWDRE